MIRINHETSKTMKKTVLLIVLFAFITAGLFAQNYVSKEPQNKNAIIEEFTGVRCGYCPQGHDILADILETYPDRAFAVGYHPSNTSLTQPYPNNPDFRRDFPNEFFTSSYCGTGPFMPGAFVNRKIWSAGERLRSRNQWMQHTSAIIAEPSPLNVGLTSSYDIFADEVDMTVEVYFTSTVEEDLTINVVMSENNLIAQQASGGNNYVHYHVFREAFTGQWGNTITNTTSGSYKVYNYHFDNSETGYDLMECELMAFVYDTENEIVISGIGADVGKSTWVKPQAGFNAGGDTSIYVGDSVQFYDGSLYKPTSWHWTFEGGTPETSTEENPIVYYYEEGLFTVELVVENPAGIDTITKNDYIEVGTTGIDPKEVASFRVFPNPSNGIIHLQPENMNGADKVSIFNISGEKVREVKINNNNISINMKDLPDGIYLIEMKTNIGVYSQKILLRK